MKPLYQRLLFVLLSTAALWLALRVKEAWQHRDDVNFSTADAGGSDITTIINIVKALMEVYAAIPDDYKGCVLSSAGAGVAAWGISRAVRPDEGNRNRCVAVGTAVFGVTTALSVAAVNYHSLPSALMTALWSKADLRT
ncbi:hypothetical protein M406DRAFT_324243 [Cryphonectria parasitica EP155]|uniref:Uncharacterized protein n=1 Tax=Cryphonectria parasitica (strain ATCC 38755 / EP155) TaxID=660469 RepID=A0A9P5CLH2_CRYP1|nr:uncharacterized protein M406DRAFT_324243 [Cryphonectria parasitica EP155]KAF3761825.1 hypothetical protein M406DRAFT_324243 [Cryphonectria parasitica EP155]